MINYQTPTNLGIGLARGSACRIYSGEKILDYSGRILNLASRLMDIARPSGIVFDSSFGYDLLQDKIKELFSSDDNVYLRSVAEKTPMTIYFTKEYTIISDYNKTPIIDYKWKTELFETHSSYYRNIYQRTPKELIKYALDKEPVSPDRITLEMHIPLLLNGEQTGREKIFSIKEGNLSYKKVGRKSKLYIKIEEIMIFIKENDDIFDEKETIKIEITYPIKTN